MENCANKLNPGVVALGWVSFLTDVASDMIYPLLPDFLTRLLGAGPAALGVIEGVAESTASVTKMLSGWWSDRLRRRKPLVLAGYALAAVVRPLVAFAMSWTQVLAIRFADRVGKGIRTSPRDALVAGLVPPERRGRAFGLQRAMDNAGAFLGPLLAAFLLKFWIHDERTVFLLALVPGVAAVVLLAARVKEAKPRQEAPPRREPDLSASGKRLPSAFWVATGIFVLFTFANSTDAFLLLRAGQSGVELWQIPLLWAFFNGAKATFALPGGILADRIGRLPTIALGWVIYALAYAGFAFVVAPLAVWGLFAGYALFYGMTEGAERALVADLVPGEMRGRAFGFFHASVGLAALPASILFGIWWTAFGPRTAFLIGGGLAILATGFLLTMSKKIRDATESV
jgi:MFS family permease